MKPNPEALKHFPPPPARIFCSLIFTPELVLTETLDALIQVWGPLEYVSRRLPFSYTKYYAKEMGDLLSRKFVTFLNRVSQDSLHVLKGSANRVERLFLNAAGGREVNIDPGLLLPDKLVLATTKPCAHRPYLSDGIYADLTLVFQNGSFQALPWTYPDYASEETIHMLNTLRTHDELQKEVGHAGGNS